MSEGLRALEALYLLCLRGSRALEALYLYCLGAHEHWKYRICSVWGLTSAGSTVFVVFGKI